MFDTHINMKNIYRSRRLYTPGNTLLDTAAASLGSVENIP